LVHTILDGIHDPLDAPRDLLKGAPVGFRLSSPFMVQAIGFLGISTHRGRHGLGRHQLVGETRQHAPLDVVTANGTSVGTGPFAEMTETAVAIVRDDPVIIPAITLLFARLFESAS